MRKVILAGFLLCLVGIYLAVTADAIGGGMTIISGIAFLAGLIISMIGIINMDKDGEK